MRISDWSSDVCSSDLPPGCGKTFAVEKLVEHLDWPFFSIDSGSIGSPFIHETGKKIAEAFEQAVKVSPAVVVIDEIDAFLAARDSSAGGQHRSEEHTSELQSLMRISYAVFCLKKKKLKHKKNEADR